MKAKKSFRSQMLFWVFLGLSFLLNGVAAKAGTIVASCSYSGNCAGFQQSGGCPGALCNCTFSPSSPSCTGTESSLSQCQSDVAAMQSQSGACGLSGGTQSCSATCSGFSSSSSSSSSANPLANTSVGGLLNGFGATNLLGTDVGQAFWIENNSEQIQNWVAQVESQLEPYPVLNQQESVSTTTGDYDKRFALDYCDGDPHCSYIGGSTPSLLSQPDEGGPINTVTDQDAEAVDCASLQEQIDSDKQIVGNMSDTAAKMQTYVDKLRQSVANDQQASADETDKEMGEFQNDMFKDGILTALGGAGTGLQMAGASTETSQILGIFARDVKEGFEYVDTRWDALKYGTKTASAALSVSSGQSVQSYLQKIVVDPGALGSVAEKLVEAGGTSLAGPAGGLAAKGIWKLSAIYAEDAIDHWGSHIDQSTIDSLQTTLDNMNLSYRAQLQHFWDEQNQLQQATTQGQCWVTESDLQ